jgi:hypothetical protein
VKKFLSSNFEKREKKFEKKIGKSAFRASEKAEVAKTRVGFQVSFTTVVVSASF